jgi:hypothetical protein
MSIPVLPVNIDFNKWASQIRTDFPDVDIPIPPKSPENWKSWASQVVNSNGLTNVPLPTITAYPHVEDWRKWGAWFINSLTSS